MSNKKYLISVISWEDRFKEGLPKLLDKLNPQKVILFYYKEYWDRTQEVISNLKALKKEGFEIEYNEIYFSDLSKTWSILLAQLEIIERDDEVFFDLTTAPREFIWMALNILKHKNTKVSCYYHEPKGYGDWQSRNPKKPRVVYKLGGITKLGQPTRLLISTGYDLDRVQQLITYYEPDKVVLCIQSGVRAKNEEAQQKYEQLLNENPYLRDTIEKIEVDSYSADCGMKTYAAALKKLEPDSHNILLCSLGPKLSALPLFILHRSNESTALVYAPSSDYNIDYSHGLKATQVCKICKDEIYNTVLENS